VGVTRLQHIPASMSIASRRRPAIIPTLFGWKASTPTFRRLELAVRLPISRSVGLPARPTDQMIWPTGGSTLRPLA
jgi:hypothetical protein